MQADNTTKRVCPSKKKIMNVNTPSTQEEKVLDVLEKAREGKVSHPLFIKDGWVNKQYFVRVMYLTQAGRALWNLENTMGIEIEHSTFTDGYGFKSYRLVLKDRLF